MAGPDAPQRSALCCQVLQETLRGTPVAGNGGGREFANFAEVTRILAAQTRWLSCCLAAIDDQAIGDQLSLQRVDGSCTEGILLFQGLTAIFENRVVELLHLVYAAAA